MGEVYRARDSRLSRDVALKVLSTALANDVDYMARFEREAQVLASLNHPNIAAIYGLEEADSVRALVMELVEGPTLAERMAIGPIPLEESLLIARQIAEALEAAHDKGIVHRDLKPANVKLTQDDRVKVLDFGLAKALDADPTMSSRELASSPTMTIRMTRAGMILGTAAYMSPEQGKGKAVDRRADIWAFGVVLVEMLSGRPAYEGETAGEILASVIKDPVPLSGLPTATPVAIRRLLDRCLDKDPKRRLRDIGEARIVIEETLRAGAVPEPAIAEPATALQAPRLPWMVASALLACIAIFTGSGWWRSTRPVMRPLIRFDLDLGLAAGPGRSVAPRAVVSPDGSRIVFSGTDSANRQRLFTRLLNQAEGSPLNGTEDGDSPFFSPDGEWLGFASGGKLKKVPLAGGSPTVLCDAPRLRGASWGEGFIAAALDIRGGLSRIPEEGGPPQLLTKLDVENKEVTHRFPFFLPGGKVILFNADSKGGNYEQADIVAQSMESGKRSVLHRGGYLPRYVPFSASAPDSSKGFLLYMSQGVLFAAPMDADLLALTAAPVRVLDGIAATPGSGAAQFDVSRNGIALLQKGSDESATRLFWLDSSGAKQPLPAKTGLYSFPKLSPDGKRLAILLRAGGNNLSVYDWERDVMSRMSVGEPGKGQVSWSPSIWSPDGKHLGYADSSAGGIVWIRSDGAGEPQLFAGNRVPGSFSPDGRHFAVVQRNASRSRIEIVPIDGVETDRPKVGNPEEFALGAGGQWDPKFSADGRWIAYTSGESGRSEVYVRAYPGPAGKWQISTGGGNHPVWSPKHRELYYSSDDLRIMAAPFTVEGDRFVPEKPRVWSHQQISENTTAWGGNFDITPDGKRFIALLYPDSPDAQRAANSLTVLLNFTDELRRRVPAGK